MKIRIQDNSVRLRVTIKELETLAEFGEVMRETNFPGSGILKYGVRRTADANSSIRFDGSIITVQLADKDVSSLQRDDKEGVYFYCEPDGNNAQRFMYFVEKDRPGAACEKPEHWIYDEISGKTTDFTPIKRGG